MEQYDAYLGGAQSLPETLNLLRYTAARSSEIKELQDSLKTFKGVKMAFQKLPKHMRRRVMSHNVKRIPRKLREIHKSQLTKSGFPPKQKRPCRKYRRRPRNLLDEYERRGRRVKWLETHIWHAKRFHMVEKWGWKLADRPCDKAFRACYRASMRHCLLQDVSYLSCLEINGRRDAIIEGFKSITRINEGLSVGAKAFIDGKREGTIMLYEIGLINAIGRVNFNWKPKINGDADVLWVWAHPAFYQDVFDLLTIVFKTVRRNSLNRFRLTGPLSNAILHKTLTAANPRTSTEWLHEYLQNDALRQLYSDQFNFFTSTRCFNTPSNLPPHLILSLIVSDPRYNVPKKRSKAMPDDSDGRHEIPSLFEGMSGGAVWSADVREAVKRSKVTNAAIAELRAAQLIPGSEIDLKPAVPVPIMLVQRPGVRELNGYGCGWDVIIPADWSLPFWLCFVMWGARTGGLRESAHIAFESGQPDFLPPDTKAGRTEEKEAYDQCVERFFRLPPNKRPNYNKFAIASPFKCPWGKIVGEWRSGGDDYRVLRDKQILETVQEIINGIKRRKSSVDLLQIKNIPLDTLIPVRLIVKKGLMKKFAVICLPKNGDLKKQHVEKITPDKYKEQRKIMRSKHKALLKQLHKKRKLAKSSGTKIPIDGELLKNYQEKMRKLWLPDLEGSLRNSCSREIMGFVTKAGFSYIRGHCVAIGYVASGALLELVTKQFKEVLVRNTNSRVYKTASIEIIL